MQAGRRIFEIFSYRPGSIGAHTMTPRQDGGFFAGLKMSHLVTSQDFGSQDFLRAAVDQFRKARSGESPRISLRVEMCSVSEPGFSADEVAGSKGN